MRNIRNNDTKASEKICANCGNPEYKHTSVRRMMYQFHCKGFRPHKRRAGKKPTTPRPDITPFRMKS